MPLGERTRSLTSAATVERTSARVRADEAGAAAGAGWAGVEEEAGAKENQLRLVLRLPLAADEALAERLCACGLGGGAGARCGCAGGASVNLMGCAGVVLASTGSRAMLSRRVAVAAAIEAYGGGASGEGDWGIDGSDCFSEEDIAVLRKVFNYRRCCSYLWWECRVGSLLLSQLQVRTELCHEKFK